MTIKTRNPQPYAVERKNKSITEESSLNKKNKNKPKLSKGKIPETK